MSSWLQLCRWHDEFALGLYPWQSWVEHLKLPLPAFDLTRILDASAAYDIAVHALHWQSEHEQRHVNLTPHMVRMMNAIGVRAAHQQQYMARALYAHCSRYITGMPRISDPPTDHIDCLPVVPSECLEELARATLTPWPALSIESWLERVLQQNKYKSLQLCNSFRSTRSSGRRGRKHSCAAEHKAIADRAQQMTDEALRRLTALAPLHVPLLRCHVVSVASGKINLVLSAQPRALCDG